VNPMGGRTDMGTGARIGSVWCQQTFTPDAVQELASTACPNFKLMGDTALIAERMNEAAAGLLIALNGETLPSEAGAWASDIADAAAAIIKACGPRHWDTALRIGYDTTKMESMLELIREARQKALVYVDTGKDADRAA
jgi:hypothetical protein